MFPHPAVDTTRSVDAATLPAVVASLARLFDQAGAPIRSDPGARLGAEWLTAVAAAVAEAARVWDGFDGRLAAAPASDPTGAAEGQDGGWLDGAGVPLLRTPAVEVRAVRWAVGQGTRAHDHGGALTAVAVVAGELVEDRFEPPLWRASGRRRRLPAGAVVTLPPDHTHVIANPGPDPAASIHVVSPPSLAPRPRSVGAATFLAELSPVR